MKYGLELSRRSVPEWKAHNIDYNEIKHLIKRATTTSGDTQADNDLLKLLFDEYESVNLFVKSKSGEIDRRIEHCEKIVDSLAIRNKKKPEPSTKVFQLQRDVSRLTHDIQALSRFIGAQRTGFRKLLKKYRKWSTRSKADKLSKNFLPILESPDSFINHDFTTNFLELSLLYDVIRNNKFEKGIFHHQSPVLELPSKSLCRFDCEMITSVTQSSTFWVHQDNVMELKVALLQHMGLYSTDDETNQLPDETSVVYLDDTKKFYSLSGSSDPGQIRWVNQNNGMVLLSPTGGLRHFSSMSLTQQQTEAVLDGSVDTSKLHLNTSGKLALGWVEKRHALPVSKVTSQRTRYMHCDEAATSNNADPSSISNLDHPYVWAVLDNNIKMTKNVTNTEPACGDCEGGQFPHAVLEIRWKGMNKPEWVTELESSHLVKYLPEFSMFAHSVAVFYKDALQQLPEWLRLIEDNVDIRRSPATTSAGRKQRRNSATSSHKVTTPGTATNSILLNDNSNSDDYFSSRRNSATVPGLVDSNHHDFLHPGATSTAGGVSSDNNSVSSSQMAAKLSTSQSKRPVVRYWNEFDDPESGSEGEGVFLLAQDRHRSHNDGLFSQNNVESLVRISDKFVQGISKRLWFSGGGTSSAGSSPPQKKRHVVRLMKDDDTESIIQVDTPSDEEDGDGYFYDDSESMSQSSLYSPRYTPKRNANQNKGYDTFPDEDYDIPQAQRRDVVLTFLYSGCFFLSALMTCILFGVMAGEDMTSVTYGTFAFIISGLLFALGVGIMGMCLFLLREEPSWVHQTIVFTVFFTIVCCGVGGLAWMLA